MSASASRIVAAPHGLWVATWAVGLVVALVLAGTGLGGVLPLGLGYVLFAAAEILLACGAIVFGVFALTRLGEHSHLFDVAAALLALGGLAYIWSVTALGASYTHLAMLGMIEWPWLLFGPSILAALTLLDVGLYRKLIRNNLPTWRRYRPYIARGNADIRSLRRTLIDEVILHRSLFRVSRIRWLRHTLIFWGFAAMFAAELVAVVVRDGFPAFGWHDIWREPGHPVRILFDFVYDFTGVMMLAGCLLALGWRVAVNNKPERRYSDTPTTIFLLAVVVTGFVVEGLRMIPTLGDPAHAVSFGGWATAHLLAASRVDPAHWDRPAWLIHVIGSCVFIAYVPAMRLIHSCATPMGRLMYSQKEMLAAKKLGVLGAMLRGPANDAARLSRPRPN